jgi:hypothetical protein
VNKTSQIFCGTSSSGILKCNQVVVHTWILRGAQFAKLMNRLTEETSTFFSTSRWQVMFRFRPDVILIDSPDLNLRTILLGIAICPHIFKFWSLLFIPPIIFFILPCDHYQHTLVSSTWRSRPPDYLAADSVCEIKFTYSSGLCRCRVAFQPRAL